jgi:hypothetical protein
MTSAAWEAEVFYCRAGIIDTCRSMLLGFLNGEESKRRADAWRLFCRYVRYLQHCFTERQGTGSQLTKAEQAHVPLIDTIDGITDIFGLLSTTFLLNVIDSRQYPEKFTPLSPREKEEIRLAQLDACTLIQFLDDVVDLVDLRSGEAVSAKKAFFSYFVLQGRWLLSELRCRLNAHSDEVYDKLAAADFLQGDYARSMLKGEDWKGQATKPANCFTPLNEALKIGFPNSIQENMKRKSIQSSTEHSSKRRKVADGDLTD